MHKATAMPGQTGDATGRIRSRSREAFAAAERKGLILATQVRSVALVLILIWLLIDNPSTGMAYVYEALELTGFAALGIIQYYCFRAGFYTKYLKYFFILLDCALLAWILTVPGPYDSFTLPPAVAMDGARSIYFLMFLMQAAFGLRPLLVIWAGLCIVGARLAMLLWYVRLPETYTNFDLPNMLPETLVAARADPNFLYLGFWTIEIIVTLLLTGGMAVLVRRSRALVENQARAERSRASLARYFSPNMIDHLTEGQNALATVKEQNVAVLFADIRGFTKMCEDESPLSAITLLRQYHNRLGQAVFANDGTLDKYIGDGLMATFGTPVPGPNDAENALQCAFDMIAALKDWNHERARRNEAPVTVGIGVHFGPVIVGDIGNERRLEFSVIGDTVNIASRLEHLTRRLETPLVVSDDLIAALPEGSTLADGLTEAGLQEVRGRRGSVKVRVLKP